MALANVISLQSGTNFIIDVTAAQLSDKITEKDFTVRHNGTAVSNVNYNKTTQNTLTYVGAALPSNTTIEIRRKTSFDQTTNLVPYANRFSTTKWNDALLKIQRWEEEVDLNGAGSIGAGVIPIPANDPYGVIWTNDTVYSPTRKAIWDKVETLAPKVSPGFTGAPTAPTPAFDNNSTRLATTAHVKSVLGNTPSITNPTVSNGAFTSPTIATPGISGGTLANASITGATVETSTLVAPAITNGGSVSGVLTVPTASPIYTPLNTAQVISHQDVSTVLNNRFLVNASQSSTVVITNNAYQGLTFSNVTRNIASSLNGASGVFIAPVAGWYLFSVYLSLGVTGGTLPTSIRMLLDTTAGGRLFDLVMQNTGSIGTSGQLALSLAAGATVAFNALVIATGGSGYTLNLAGSGINRLNVFYLAT